MFIMDNEAESLKVTMDDLNQGRLGTGPPNMAVNFLFVSLY